MLLLLLLLINSAWGELECDDILTTVLTGSVSNGTLQTEEFKFQPNLFMPINETHFNVCICEVRPCLRKCCPVGEIMNRMVCTKQKGMKFEPQVFNDSLTKLPSEEVPPMFLTTGITCPQSIVNSDRVHVHFFETFLLENGSLLLPAKTTADRRLFHPEDFCLENFLYYDRMVYGPAPFLCYEKASPLNYPIIYMVGLAVSILCLFVTLIYFALFPEAQNLNGKCLMCHSFSLMAGFISILASRLGPKDYSQESCMALAISTAFWSLATFSWLNIMCFDIWLNFRCTKFSLPPTVEIQKKRFIWYSIYSWGLPVLLIIFTISMDLVPHHSLPNWFIQPEFGISRCWYSDVSKLFYFFVPVAILLCCNILFFALTAYNLVQKGKERALVKENQKRSNNDLQQVSFHLRLFLVMGINWIMEVIVQFVVIKHDVFNYFRLMANVFNTWQGMIIFLMFVWKRDVKRKIIAKFGHLVFKGTTLTESWRKCGSLQIAENGVKFKGTYKPEPNRG